MKKHEVNPWLEAVARIGFVAKGLIYIIIGFLAFKIVIGMGGETAGLKEVLKTIDKQAHPFGDLLLAMIALGLIAHAYWRFMQSVFNADNKKADFKNIIDRIGYFTSVILYGVLAYYSFRIIFGLGTGGTAQTLTGSVLSKPFGKWLIIIAGLSTGGSGLYQVYFGLFSKFEFKYNLKRNE